jgi:hypothetical protein
MPHIFLTIHTLVKYENSELHNEELLNVHYSLYFESAGLTNVALYKNMQFLDHLMDSQLLKDSPT